MSTDVTAERYAEAIFEIGKSAGKLDIFQSNAEDFLGILKDSKELYTALTHPNIERAQRRRIIDEVLQHCRYDRVYSNFLRLVAERGRMSHYSNIVRSMSEFRDRAAGRLRGIVYSAQPLSSEQCKRLRAKVGQVLGREVVLNERLDASLIGGLRVEIDGKVYDSSVRRELEKMQERMLNQTLA